jgi:hypothetical protein
MPVFFEKNTNGIILPYGEIGKTKIISPYLTLLQKPAPVHASRARVHLCEACWLRKVRHGSRIRISQWVSSD